MEAYEKAYHHWRKLADKGYGERTNTPDAMKRVDDRIRKAKERYESLLRKFKAKPKA